MDPQATPTTAPPAVTYAHHRQQYEQPQYAYAPQGSQHYENDYQYSEKEQYAHPQQQQRASKGSNRRGHDSVMSHPFSPKASSPPSPSSSVSSGHGHRGEMQQIQPAPIVAYPAQARVDPEKHSYGGSRERDANVTTVLYDASMYTEKGPEEKPVQLLLFLSGPCALLSFVITLWAMFCLLLALVLSPFRPLSAQIQNFLSPALNLQLRLIYSYPASESFNVPMLVVIHLFSPIVAMGIAVAAWTAACFWFFNVILGDPAGQDQGKHNDGKNTLLGVRNWWDRWLSRGLQRS